MEVGTIEGGATIHRRPHADTSSPKRRRLDTKSGALVPHIASSVHGDLEPPPASSLVMSDAHRSFCKACSLAKVGARPSYAKDTKENIPFLQRIQGDICGPIHPLCGPYFMVLVDASTRWSHVALLSTRNAAYAKLLAQIIHLRAHHPDHPIKSICLDNAGEFTFDDYCVSIGIDVEHSVPHVHTQMVLQKPPSRGYGWWEGRWSCVPSYPLLLGLMQYYMC